VVFYGNPDELDLLAGRLEASAGNARARADALWFRSRGIEWESVTAGVFRSKIGEDVTALRHAAGQLDEAAQALRQHAETVRERIAQIRAIEYAVTQWFDEQRRRLYRLADEAVDTVVGAGRAAGRAGYGMVAEGGNTVLRLTEDPPWARWPWTPHNLPQSGDKQWLEVGAFLRRQGALP